MIAFDHVTYTYEGRGQPSLRDCSFTVEPGELILLTCLLYTSPSPRDTR